MRFVNKFTLFGEKLGIKDIELENKLKVIGDTKFHIISSIKTVFGVIEDWLEEHRLYSENISNVTSKSPSGDYGVIGASRTSDYTGGEEHYSAIGVGGFGINDNTDRANPAWGGYFEGRRIGECGTSMGIEIDVGSYHSTPKNQTPYSAVDGSDKYLIGLNLSSGLGYTKIANGGSNPYSTTEDSKPASSAIWVHSNPIEYLNGLVFQAGAVKNDCISMPWSSLISFYYNEYRDSFLTSGGCVLTEPSDTQNASATFRLRKRKINYASNTTGGEQLGTVSFDGKNASDYQNLANISCYQTSEFNGNNASASINLSVKNSDGNIDTVSFNSVGIVPQNDVKYALGDSTHRWQDIYLENSPTVTSDERLKSDVCELTENEIECIKGIKFKKYKIGDNSKYSVGVIAQELIDRFKEYGLDANDYNLLKPYKKDGTEYYAIRYEELLSLYTFAFASSLNN